jgi:dihydrofolate synthase/folylpolyglutamate synthase
VALDHQDLLGATIPEIAREKAAIIKPGNLAITAAVEPALTAVRDRAAAVGATLTVIREGIDFSGRAAGMAGITVETSFDGRRISLRSPLRGGFQVANVASAVAICDALRESGIAIDAGAVTRGSAAVHWPGRMDWIDGTPPLLIDGAHNPAGMAAMVASARDLIGARRCVAIFAAMRNKDAASMAAALAELTTEIVVTAPAVERASPPSDLSGLFVPPAEIAADVETALERARRIAGRDGVVVVCGSLYLAGEVLGLLSV